MNEILTTEPARLRAAPLRLRARRSLRQTRTWHPRPSPGPASGKDSLHARHGAGRLRPRSVPRGHGPPSATGGMSPAGRVPALATTAPASVAPALAGALASAAHAASRTTASIAGFGPPASRASAGADVPGRSSYSSRPQGWPTAVAREEVGRQLVASAAGCGDAPPPRAASARPRAQLRRARQRRAGAGRAAAQPRPCRRPSSIPAAASPQAAVDRTARAPRPAGAGAVAAGRKRTRGRSGAARARPAGMLGECRRPRRRGRRTSTCRPICARRWRWLD